jgi:hypothetical protein
LIRKRCAERHWRSRFLIVVAESCPDRRFALQALLALIQVAPVSLARKFVAQSLTLCCLQMATLSGMSNADAAWIADFARQHVNHIPPGTFAENSGNQRP